MTDHHYVFDGTKEQAELDRLRLLESAFDPKARQRLENVGVSDGWHYLEVGAGAGSIMNWISEKVGSTGTVVAVDTDTRFLLSSVSSNTVIVKGDIRTVDLGRSRFDLVHGRYILLHIPEFASVLEKMLLLFKPGGWLVFEEPDFSAARCLVGSEDALLAFDRVSSAIETMYKATGIDHTAGLKIPKALSALRIKNLFVDNVAPSSRGGSPIARMMGMSAGQLRERYIQTKKCTGKDVDIYRTFAEDPGTWAIYYSTVCVSGQLEIETDGTQS